MKLTCTCGRNASDPSSHFGDCPVRVWFEEQDNQQKETP